MLNETIARLCGCGAPIWRGNTTGRCRRCNGEWRGKNNKGRPGYAAAGPGATGWLGDGATSGSKHRRAQRMFKLADDLECDRCESPAVLRHHRDGNPGNNVKSNIEFLCRSCHAKIHKLGGAGGGTR